MQAAKVQNAATSHEIRGILGSADNEIIKSIMDTGASRKEIAEAFEWLNDDDYMEAIGRRMGEQVRRVYIILQSDRDRISRDD